MLRLDGQELFFSTAVWSMDGMASALARGRALVFLNVCHTGEPIPTLVGPGGFAYEFVRRGARAVIAPLWAVDSAVAYAFAKAFYDRVTAEPHIPFSEILQNLRANAYAVVTDAYLAELARARDSRLATFDRGLAELHADVADLVPTGPPPRA